MGIGNTQYLVRQPSGVQPMRRYVVAFKDGRIEQLSCASAAGGSDDETICAYLDRVLGEELGYLRHEGLLVWCADGEQRNDAVSRVIADEVYGPVVFSADTSNIDGLAYQQSTMLMRTLQSH